jgi:ribonuclease HI
MSGPVDEMLLTAVEYLGLDGAPVRIKEKLGPNASNLYLLVFSNGLRAYTLVWGGVWPVGTKFMVEWAQGRVREGETGAACIVYAPETRTEAGVVQYSQMAYQFGENAVMGAPLEIPAEGPGSTDAVAGPAETRPLPVDADNVKAVYTDGGVIGRNPSTVGGTWAYCFVDAPGPQGGTRVAWASGLEPCVDDSEPVTNNLMEYIAVLKALEALPPGWSGNLYSDSQITLGRVLRSWATNGIPDRLVERMTRACARLGPINPVLLQGHPTRADLEKGVGVKRGFPVSEHNVWADNACTEAGKAYVEALGLRGVEVPADATLTEELEAGE